MRDIIVTTTDSIEGCEVIQYLDVVCSNVVIGTNLFSDITASFRDLFGGRSKSYQKKLQLIQREVTKELKYKASSFGANAILGFKLDFNEISGGNKSMFMVSGSGTACVINIEDKNVKKEGMKLDAISKSQLDMELKRRHVLKGVNDLSNRSNGHFNDEWFEFLFEYPQSELTGPLVDRLISCYKFPDEYNLLISQMEQVLNLVPIDILEKEVYDRLLISRDEVTKIINDLDLFSPKYVLDLCNKGKISCTLSVLSMGRKQYTKDDILLMKEIIEKLKNLPDRGKIEMVKGLLTKDTEKYICPNGHKNNVDFEFCGQCELNIKGLSRENMEKIKNFELRIGVLEELFN